MKFSDLKKPLQEKCKIWTKYVFDHAKFDANEMEIAACKDISMSAELETNLSTETIAFLWAYIVTDIKNGNVEKETNSAYNQFFIDMGFLTYWNRKGPKPETEPYVIIRNRKWYWLNPEKGSPLDIAWRKIVGLYNSD